MAGNFSKFELTTGLVALGKKLPAIAAPAQKNASKGIALLGNSWVLGGLVMFFFALLLLTAVIGAQQARRGAIYPQLSAQLQIHHERVTNAAQPALLGDAAAFAQLQDSRNQLDHVLTLLLQGGAYRDMPVAAADEGSLPSVYAYAKHWQLEDNKIGLILNQQESLVRLNSSIRAIQIAHSQLARRIEELAAHLANAGNLAQEVRTVEAIKLHARSIAKNVKTLLPIELPMAEISAQLSQDQAQIAAMMQTLGQGHHGLGAVSSKNEAIQDLLSHVYAQLRKFDDHLQIIRKEMPAAAAAESAAADIVNGRSIMLNTARALDDEVQQQRGHSAAQLNAVLIALGACALLALLLLVRVVRRNAYYQDLASRNEVEKAQKAIVTLLDDMKKIADGDLTVRTDISNHMTSAIADAINSTIEELHTLVEQVNQAGALVVKSSQQAQQVSSGLLHAAEHQTAKIEQTTLAVVGMTESISDISDRATESAKVAKQSLAAAEKGALAVRESITGMNEIRTHIQDTSKRIKRLGESSQEIGEIVALITGITDQTNVLALNAALQATAAGEAGHGFTVIAQEVQRLAERSAEASKQISELIVTIQSDTRDAIAAMERSTLGVAKGTKRSDAAGRALEEIEQVSKQLAQLVTHIFEVTNTQTRAAHKVVANMEEILHITRQTTQGTLKTTGSIKQIAGFASELKASVSNFKV